MFSKKDLMFYPKLLDVFEKLLDVFGKKPEKLKPSAKTHKKKCFVCNFGSKIVA